MACAKIATSGESTARYFSFFCLGGNIKTTQSMSRKENCWDNVVAGSFFKTIKYEMIYRKKYTNFEVLKSDIQKYINWYNYKRLHSAIGYKSPFEKEIELSKNKIKKIA